MNAKHIDQLAQWWENAETGTPNPRDLLIVNLGADEYLIEHAGDYWGEGEEYEDTRILARAPKPKPAWHDAVAVIAHTDDGHIRQVWERDGDTDYWCGTEGYLVRTEKLRDVTPLIEAKVTDEMAERAREEFFGGDVGGPVSGPSSARRWRAALTAALGLETA